VWSGPLACRLVMSSGFGGQVLATWDISVQLE